MVKGEGIEKNPVGKLEGKVALVTGASRGIGKAIALAYAREGAKLFICARRRAGLNICSNCGKRLLN